MAKEHHITARFANIARELGQSELGRLLHWTPSKVSNVIRGRSRLSLEDCEDVVAKTAIRREWFYAGIGPMRKGHVEGRIKELEAPYSTDPGAEPNLESAIRVVGQALDRVKERPIPPILVVSPDQVAQVMKDMGADARQYVPVPYMEQKVAAGLPLEIADDRVKDYLLVHRRVARRPETLFGVQVQGDSMDPRYPSGSIVVVDRSQSDPAALIHRVILAVLDDSAAVKILNQDASHWILESQNPKYRPMYVDRAENPVIGRVIGGWVEEG